MTGAAGRAHAPRRAENAGRSRLISALRHRDGAKLAQHRNDQVKDNAEGGRQGHA
jgi:hypothetical protein